MQFIIVMAKAEISAAITYLLIFTFVSFQKKKKKKKKKHNVKVFTVTFDEFNTFLLNKISINV